MKDWWSRLSLKNKLQIPIQLILLALMVVAQRTALEKFEEHVLHGALQKAVVAADGVLNGLNMLMLNGTISDAEQRTLYVNKMGATEGMLELRVIRNKPVQDQYGPGLPSEQPSDEMDQLALSSAKQQSRLIEREGRQALRVIVPFIALKDFRGTNCLMCHTVPEGTVNGAASITVDVSDDIAVIRKANQVSWGAQIVVQLLLYFLIGWLINFVIRPTRELQAVMQTMQADGDLAKRATVHNQDEIGKTAQAFNELAGNFQSIVGQVGSHASQVASAAHSLAQDAEQISQGAQQQSDVAATTSAAVEQVSTSIGQVAEGTDRVAALSHESLERANRGQESLKEMVQELDRVEDAVKAITASVGKFVTNTQSITSMTRQVRDIAEQTNLLALNAAIEAARAGEQGRGFAVVADEVRKLAEKSAKSASQIDEVTKSLGEQSEQVEMTIQRGMDALQSSQKNIREVASILVEANTSVDNVNHGLREISESINRQRDSAREIADNVDHIASMSSQSNEAVKRTLESVHSMEQLSEELRSTVGRFKV